MPHTERQNMLEAWARMHRKRTCPPFDELMKGGEEITAHLAECPECRELVEEAESYRKMARLLGPAPKEKMPMEAGQIRRIRQDSRPSLRGKDGWHRPPAVLLLPPKGGAWRGAIVHDEPELADEGDVPMGDDFPGMYAEAWNTLSLSEQSLTNPTGTVNPDIVRAVEDAAGKAYPQPAPYSIRDLFQETERATAAFFALPATEPSMDALAAAIQKLTGIFTAWGNTLAERLAGANWQGQTSLVPLACAPESSLPPFLRGEERHGAVVIALVDGKGLPARILPRPASFSLSADDAGGWLASARLPYPKDMPRAILQAAACAEVNGEKTTLPAQADLDGGDLVLVFSIPKRLADAELQAAVLIGEKA